MQYAIAGTSHTPNEVLAQQSECPVAWNVHDYIAFCSLRSGGRTQWLNILRVFAAQELPFRLPEVEILLSQAAHQIGPSTEGSHSRDWHLDLSCPEFCQQLLTEFEVLLDSVKQNWLNVSAIRIVITLTLRILHHSAHGSVTQQRCDDILRASRAVTFRWLSQLIHRLEEAIEDNRVSSAQLLVYEMAMTCRSTFDLDTRHLHRLLSTDDDMSIFVQCAVRVADNHPTISTTLPSHLEHLIARERRISHFSEDLVISRLRERRTGIDQALHSIWGEYSPGVSGWSPLAPPHARWITTCSESRNTTQCVVHFNILDGTLLINGARLGRLPTEIIQHPIYKRLFGSVRPEFYYI